MALVVNTREVMSAKNATEAAIAINTSVAYIKRFYTIHKIIIIYAHSGICMIII